MVLLHFYFTGAAKKRDVRTINSSDLGPPHKTTTTTTTNNNNLITAQNNGLSPRQVGNSTAVPFNVNGRTGPALIRK